MTHLPRTTSSESTRWVEILLDAPDLPQRIRAMAPDDLLKLVHRVGLEDSAELIALADTAQLSRMLDEDLWRSPRPGTKELFDADRFGLWLEVLHAMGPAPAARRLAGLDPLFVVMALSRHVLVFETTFLQRLVADEEGGQSALIEKRIESRLHHEFGAYLAVAKDDRAWYALIDIVVELENRHQDYFHRLFRHLARLTAGDVCDSADLCDLLTLSEQLENDLLDEREQAREQEGYVIPARAAAWLHQTRLDTPEALLIAAAPDETLRYFEKLASRELRQARIPDQTNAAAPAAWLMFQGKDSRPGGRRAHSKASGEEQWPIRRALQVLAQEDPRLHTRRLQELAYLANLLLAGCTCHHRPFHRIEAAQAAIATCNLGLDIWLARSEDHDMTPGEWLRLHTLVPLFRAGFSRLYQVASYATRTVVAFLTPMPKLPKTLPDRKWIEGQLHGLRADVEAALDRGQPWQAADQLVLLETLLEAPRVSVLSGLISEFPVWSGDGRSRRGKSHADFIHALKTVTEIDRYVKNLERGNERRDHRWRS